MILSKLGNQLIICVVLGTVALVSWACYFSLSYYFNQHRKQNVTITANNETYLMIRDLEKPKLDFPGHSLSSTFALDAMPHGLLASGGGDRFVRIWDTNSGVQLKKMLNPDENTVLGSIYAMVHIKEFLICGGSSRYIKIWNITSGNIVNILSYHQNYVTALAVLSDNSFASGSKDRSIAIWNVEDGSLRHVLNNHTDGVVQLAKISDEYLASASYDKTILIWSLINFTRIETIKLKSVARSIIAFPDNKLAYGTTNEVVIYDLKSKIFKKLNLNVTMVSSMALMSNNRLAVGDINGWIKIFNLTNDTLIRSFKAHSRKIFSLTFMDNGYLASSSGENVLSTNRSIKIWQV